MTRAGAVTVAGWVLSLLMSVPAAAQQSSEELKKEVDDLKAKVKVLEENSSAKPAPEGANFSVGDSFRDIAQKIIKESKLSGFVDIGGNINPDNPSTSANRFRAFDGNANTFMMHNAQLAWERVATKDLITGFKIELTTGSDADVINATSGHASDAFDVQEAYVNILIPWQKGIDVKFGKFATLSGYEVIESKDDFNYSRSLLFTWAIPFTHTGIRASYQVIDEVKVTLGVNNGWDNVPDNNRAKTGECQVGVTPIKWLSLTGTAYYGAERSSNNADKRLLFDFTATATDVPNLPNWTFGVNYDAAVEDNSIGTAPTLQDAQWTGEAAYVKYQLLPWYAPSVRGEAFHDNDGFRTGTRQRIWEFTLTNEFKVGEDVIIRVEYRRDKSNENVFYDGAKVDDKQQTFGLEAIFIF